MLDHGDSEWCEVCRGACVEGRGILAERQEEKRRLEALPDEGIDG